MKVFLKIFNMNKNTKKDLEYKKYLQELDNPNYQGGSWTLPENATPLEQAKYEICKQIVALSTKT